MNLLKMILLVIVIVTVVSGCGSSGSEKPPVAIEGAIAFASPQHKEDLLYAEIYLLDAQGTRLLASDGAINNANPAWSPDGTQIAYITNTWQLAIIKRDGSGGAYLTPETSDPSLWPHHPAWLPDGNISFEVGGKLAILRPDGTGVRVLAPIMTQQGAPSFSGAYAWSPDGTQIVFDCPMSAPGPAVCLFDVESGENRILLEPPWRFQAFAWSPDGKQILAGDWSGGTSVLGGGEPADDLYIFDADGQGLHALAQPGREANPAWSPDGKQIAYQSHTENSEGSSLDLWLMNADGSGAQKLVSGITGVQPDWTAR